MNIVDIVVLAAVVLFAWSGWRNGFVSGLLSFIGFLGGGLIGVFIAPLILGQWRIEGMLGLAITAGLVVGCAIAGPRRRQHWRGSTQHSGDRRNRLDLGCDGNSVAGFNCVVAGPFVVGAFHPRHGRAESSPRHGDESAEPR